MNIIETIAPIPIDELKKYFADKNTKYIIDYANSKLQGAKLLTYLSNLDLPCDIKLSDDKEATYELLKEYFHSPFIVNIQSLEYLATCVMYDFKGMGPGNYNDFIDANEDIVRQWVKILESMFVFNSYTLNDDDLKAYIEQTVPQNLTDTTEGINFVSQLKNKGFYGFYEIINKDYHEFYPAYFKENMFKGKNLYHYWANENNPLFLFTTGIAEGLITGEDFLAEKERITKDLQSATPV